MIMRHMCVSRQQYVVQTLKRKFSMYMKYKRRGTDIVMQMSEFKLSHIQHRIYDKIEWEPFTKPPRPTLKMLIGAPPFAGETCRTYIRSGIAAIGFHVSWDSSFSAVQIRIPLSLLLLLLHSTTLDRIVQQVCTVRFQVYFNLRCDLHRIIV